MKSPTLIYHQILFFLRQYSSFSDLRHVNTLAEMLSALLSSQKLTLSEWESYVSGKALQAQNCRAGTTTPFAFSETLTTAVSNYNGAYTYANFSVVNSDAALQ